MILTIEGIQRDAIDQDELFALVSAHTDKMEPISATTVRVGENLFELENYKVKIINEFGITFESGFHIDTKPVKVDETIGNPTKNCMIVDSGGDGVNMSFETIVRPPYSKPTPQDKQNNTGGGWR